MQRKTTHTRSSTASTTGSDNVFILEHTQNKIAALSIQKARLSSLNNRMGNVVLSEAASLFALYLIKVYGYIYNETPNHVLATLAPILPPLTGSYIRTYHTYFKKNKSNAFYSNSRELIL